MLWRAWWRLRGLRRCRRCGLTWERPSDMAMQDGVCHDCFSGFMSAEADRVAYREALGKIAGPPERPFLGYDGKVAAEALGWRNP